MLKVLALLTLSVCSLQAANHVQKRSDDLSLGAVNTEVIRLAGQMTTLTAQLTALQQQVSSQQSKIDAYGKLVAFYAWAAESRVSTTPNGPIVLKHVETNIGNGFDAETGYFTAPVSGLYQFHATFMGATDQDDGSGYVHAALFVGSRQVGYTLSDFRHNYYDNVGLHATVHVNAGQKVHFNNAESVAKVFHGGLYLTFSGFLIRADE